VGFSSFREGNATKSLEPGQCHILHHASIQATCSTAGTNVGAEAMGGIAPPVLGPVIGSDSPLQPLTAAGRQPLQLTGRWVTRQKSPKIPFLFSRLRPHIITAATVKIYGPAEQQLISIGGLGLGTETLPLIEIPLSLSDQQ